MVSIQYGSTYAKHLFPLVGPEGATALRLSLAALILMPILRPWRARPSRGTLPALLGYGVALGCMNLLFYSALARIPLGIAVALEFTGPLALAIGHSRRRTDLLWTGLAVLGLLFLLPIGHPARVLERGLDPLGIVFALGSGIGWALYATLGKKAGGDHGWTTSAIGTAIGALIVAPVGLAHAGTALFTLPVLRLAIMVAIFSSALPFSLELFALTKLPTRVYGTLTSVEPALGAIAGFAFLHETLTLIQIAAVAAIMCASIGTAMTMQPLPAPAN